MTPAEWLNSLDKVEHAEDVTLTVGAETWQAAVYMESGGRWRIYAIGAMPKARRRSPKVCFRFQHDDRDWYVTCFLEDATRLKPQQLDFHPFRENFILGPWDHTDHRIDEFESPYTRLEAAVTR